MEKSMHKLVGTGKLTKHEDPTKKKKGGLKEMDVTLIINSLRPNDAYMRQ